MAIAARAEVWVVFRGLARVDDGVYLVGLVDSVRPSARRVVLEVRGRAENEPLAEPTRRLATAGLEPIRFEHVFLLPEERSIIRAYAPGRTSSERPRRSCDLPLIDPAALARPGRLSRRFNAFAPAFWVLPAAWFFEAPPRDVEAKIRMASELCLRFRFGESGLAEALARGMYEALAARDLVGFDCVAPIPLSPETESAGKDHRARLLSVHLARLLGIQTCDLFALSETMSKGLLRRVRGRSATEFEAEYGAMLQIDASARRFEHVLVVDDICNEGSTLSAALTRLRDENAGVTVSATVAGQIASPHTVRDEARLLGAGVRRESRRR